MKCHQKKRKKEKDMKRKWQRPRKSWVINYMYIESLVSLEVWIIHRIEQEPLFGDKAELRSCYVHAGRYSLALASGKDPRQEGWVKILLCTCREVQLGFGKWQISQIWDLCCLHLRLDNTLLSFGTRKYNLHNNEQHIWGDILQPPHGT